MDRRRYGFPLQDFACACFGEMCHYLFIVLFNSLNEFIDRTLLVL